MAQPTFRHIHCSSRYDRPPETLEVDLDNWMAHSSLITLTEVTNDNRAAKLREKGWAYYNAKDSAGKDADNCAVCWETETWARKYGAVRRLSNNTFDRANGMQNLYIWASTVILKNRKSGHKLLVSVSHPPAHVEGHGGFKTTDAGWAARKRAYMTALTNWHAHVSDLERKHKTDASLIVADWNVNLKDQWFRDLLHQKWGSDFQIAWQKLPNAGGSLHGAPGNSPKTSTHDRIIDGSLLKDLKVSDGPNLMSRVKSSDHRPYNETLQWANKPDLSEAEKKAQRKKNTQDGDLQGDIKHGDEWWNFGDYMVDEMYFDPKDKQEVSTGEAGGEVL